MKSLLLLVFLILSTPIFSQKKTARVLGEDVLTPAELKEQKRRLKLENEIRLLKKELTSEMNKAGLTPGVALYFGLSKKDKKERLQRVLKESTSIYNKANNANLLAKCNSLKDKYNKLGWKDNPCSDLETIQKRTYKNIQIANEGIDGIRKEKKKEKEKIANINKDIVDLDDELKSITNANAKNKKTLDDYNAKNKDKSIDDFLKKNPKVKKKNQINDFLSSSNKKTKKKKKGGDFLSGITKPPKFSESDLKKGYKIDYKNDTQGVVDNAGNILIPYKKWTIDEYKAGIAKVSIPVDSYSNSCSSAAQGSYYGTAYKTGFVDENGDFINDYKITFSGGFSSTYTGLILRRGNDNRSAREKQLAKERDARKRRLARTKCESGFDDWKTSIIKKYQ